MRYQLFRISLKALALLPLRINHGIGAIIGWLFYLLPNDIKRTALINLRLCLPEYNQQQRKRLLRETLIETGKSFTELGPVLMWPKRKILHTIRRVENLTLVNEAFQKNKGLIILTPHHGCWELNGLYCANFLPLTNLYRPPRESSIENILMKARERTGATLVPTNTSGVKSLYTAINRKEVVGILPDQDAGESGVYAPFFGVDANTVKLIPRLINKTGAPVLMVYAQRLPRGQGYDIHFVQPDENIYSADIKEAATAMNRSVEQCIRQQISQYQWSYKRFKRNADGGASPYQQPNL
jgi:KDO2-lipid IV(A) lauroyltransferase